MRGIKDERDQGCCQAPEPVSSRAGAVVPESNEQRKRRGRDLMNSLRDISLRRCLRDIQMAESCRSELR